MEIAQEHTNKDDIPMKSKDKLLDDFFEYILSFANSEIEKMDDADLASLLFQYGRNMAQFANRHPVIAENRYTQIMVGITSDEDLLAERRQGLLKVQKHLQGILEAIMNPSDKALIKLSGKQEVLIDIENQFVFHFTPSRFNADEFDWKDENSLLDIVFMDLIRTLDLEPDRFNRCVRCSNYFYQPTATEKKYCSQRCSSADRQERYLSKQ